MDRVVGIETEFGCLVRDPVLGEAEQVVERVKDHAFRELRLGLIDLFPRDDFFEPARSGGFLTNGGRLYIDAVGSHQEYATPECASVREVVAWDRAGRCILQCILDDLGLSDAVSFHNNSIDHFSGHTFGCHENYLVRAETGLFNQSLRYLMPFLVTRQIFAGVGRVGGHRINSRDLSRNVMQLGQHPIDYAWVRDVYGVEIDPTVDYQLSQRADHILYAVSSRVRFSRAIINPKWESYANFSPFARLHVLFGESNMSEYAAALKVGTTRLVLDLVERDLVPAHATIVDPVGDLKSISREPPSAELGRPTWRWLVRRPNRGTIRAVDLQRIYLQCAQHYLSGKDEETDWILREWENTLDGLERDPMSLADRLDWAAKRQMLQSFMEAEGVDWQDDVLHSLDLEYHNLDPSRGLYFALEEMGSMRRVVDDATVDRAMTDPPQGTRAVGRSLVIRALMQSSRSRGAGPQPSAALPRLSVERSARGIRQLADCPAAGYAVDWDLVYLGSGRQLRMPNPKRTYLKEAIEFLRGPGKSQEPLKK